MTAIYRDGRSVADFSGFVKVVLIAAILAGISFRFYHLDRKVYWEDEIFGTIHALGYTEAQIVRDSPRMHRAADLQRYFHLPADGHGVGDTIASLATEDPQHPPAYYVLSHLWMQRFGSSVAAIRTLSAIFGTIALPCAFLLAIELFGSRRVALIVVALVAISPFHVLYAQEAREYSLWTVATLLNGVAYLRALRLNAPMPWVLYAATMIGCIFIDPLSALLALGQVAYVLTLEGPQRKRVAVWFGSCLVATALAFLPWLLHMFRGTLMRGMSEILAAKISNTERVLAFLRGVRGVFVDLGSFSVGGIHSGPLNFILLAGTTVLAAFAMWHLARNAPIRASRFILLVLCLPSLFLLVHDLIFGGRLSYQGRYFTPLYLGLELGVAYLVLCALNHAGAAWQRRRVAAITLVSLLACGALSCAISSQATTWWNKDYERSRDVAAIINNSSDPLVVSDHGSSRMLGLGYYLDPRVALKLRLSCDQCDIGSPSSDDLLAQTGRFNAFYFVGDSSALTQEASANRLPLSSIRKIGVAIYSGQSNELSMFQTI